MENILSQVGKYRHAVKHWWLMLLLGIVLFLLGLVVFGYPGATYVALSVVFGLVILLSGILQLFLGAYSAEDAGRGWMIAGGIIELVLGFVLMFHPAISAMTLPYFLGFWLLFRGFSLIGLAGDIRAMKVPGMGWTLLTAIMLIIIAFIILIHPLKYGEDAVVAWVGASFLVAGVSMMAFSMQLRNLRKHIS